MTSEQSEIRARTRAKAKWDFYKHLAVYLVICLMLVFINLATSREVFWSVWPMFGWGIAIVIHAARVYLFGGSEEQIVDRLTEHELRRDEAGRR